MKTEEGKNKNKINKEDKFMITSFVLLFIILLFTNKQEKNK